MIWRKALSYEHTNSLKAAEWLDTLNHPIIINQMSRENIAKIERKLMLLYAKTGDWDKIPEKFDKIDSLEQNKSSTLYLIFWYYLSQNETQKCKCLGN